ncbi:MAG: hypothetical protein GXO37_04905 [Chloroflexi bacterium]|nr:hypothetical protein [Chloroflexota bacterium]
MQGSLVETDVYLALDVGSAFTRVFLFDGVEGQYRLIAVGQAPTTASPPVRDALVGVEQAILDLQQLSGVHLLDEDGGLIVPTSSTGEGVDAVVGTVSCGRPLRVVLMGVLPELSVASARRVVAGAYVDVVEVFTATDAFTPEEQIQRLVEAYPDIVILTGGTDQGARQAVASHVDLLLWAVRLWPLVQRPWILFAGNQALGEAVQKRLGAHYEVRLAPNVRPSITRENLTPAREAFLDIFRLLWAARTPGLEDLHLLTRGRFTLSSYGFARLARYMQRLYAPHGTMLAVDLGAAYTTAIWGAGESSRHETWPWGLGRGLDAWEHQPEFLESVAAWAPVEHIGDKEGSVVDFVHWKRWYPNTLPLDTTGVQLEETLARVLLQQIRQQTVGRRTRLDLILAAGGVLSAAPTPQHALLTLLDGLQPRGLTTVIVDYAQMAGVLGVLAEINEYVVVQVVGSAAFTPLATVLSPAWARRIAADRPVAEVTLTYSNGEELHTSLMPGMLTRLPLAPGRRAELRVRPRRGVDVGAGPGEPLQQDIVGSLLGLVLDARGRPWSPPATAEERLQHHTHALQALQLAPQERSA